MQLDINRKIIIQKNFDLVKEKHIFLKIKITYKINNVWYVFRLLLVTILCVLIIMNVKLWNFFYEFINVILFSTYCYYWT